MTDPVVIVGMARTPLGAFQGAFSAVSAAELGATAIKAAIECSRITAQEIDETLLGCVLSAGQGRHRRAKLPLMPEYLWQQGQQPSIKCVAPV